MTEPDNKNSAPNSGQDQGANTPLGQSITDIVDRTTKIVQEEIELAKAEVAVSLQNILRGSVAGIVGGVFAFFGLFVLLIGISFLISDAIDYGYWPGFLIVALLLFVFGGLLAWVALKKIKKGSGHLVPEQAIAEAKATQAVFKAELDGQEIDSVAVEETAVTADVPAVKPPTATKPAPDAKAAEAADLLAAAKEVVEKPAAPEEPPAPTFVSDKTDLPFGEKAKPSKSGAKDAKKAAKAQAKADKEAAKAKAKAEQAAAKAQEQAEKEAAKAMKAAEQEAAKARKAADKAVKKAGKPSKPENPGDDQGGES